MSREWFHKYGVTTKDADAFNGLAKVFEKLDVVSSLTMMFHSDSWYEGEDDHLDGHYYMMDEILVFVVVGDKSYMYDIDTRYY